MRPGSLPPPLDVECATKRLRRFLGPSCEAMEVALTIADQARGSGDADSEMIRLQSVGPWRADAPPCFNAFRESGEGHPAGSAIAAGARKRARRARQPATTTPAPDRSKRIPRRASSA